MYVLTGGSGVLGTEFQRIAPKFGIDILPLTREDVFDISVDAEICAHLNDNPDYGAGAEGVIHCAALRMCLKQSSGIIAKKLLMTT